MRRADWIYAKPRPSFLCVFCFPHCFDCWVSATELLCRATKRVFHVEKRIFPLRIAHALRLSRAFAFNSIWRACKKAKLSTSALCEKVASSVFHSRVLLVVAIIRTENSVNFDASLMIFHPSKRFFLCRVVLMKFLIWKKSCCLHHKSTLDESNVGWVADYWTTEDKVASDVSIIKKVVGILTWSFLCVNT